MDTNDDIQVDDILVDNKKKKVDGGKKGKRTERNLVAMFTNRFGEGFSRSVGSGNRWGQVANLPNHAKEVFSGDLVVPENFRFVIESKGGYKNIDLNSIFICGNRELDGFFDQVSADSQRCGREPLLVWKQDRKPWLAFVRRLIVQNYSFKYNLQYGDWICVALECLFKLDDSFFFNSEKL